jgi:hypothetical protein
MSLDKLLTKGTITFPNIVLYGSGGRGKSSTAALFPNPIFLDTDHSIDAFDVTKTPKLKGWEASIEANKHLGLKYWLDFLINEKHDFKTVVLDCLDPVEKYFEEIILREYNATSLNDDNIKALNFGKGSVMLSSKIQGSLLNKLSILSKEKGMFVVILVHQAKRTVKMPHGDDYQQTVPLLEGKTIQLLEHWADIIGLLDVTQVVGSKDKKIVNSKDSYVFTEKKEAYLGKQRQGFQIPEIIDARKFADVMVKLSEGNLNQLTLKIEQGE